MATLPFAHRLFNNGSLDGRIRLPMSNQSSAAQGRSRPHQTFEARLAKRSGALGDGGWDKRRHRRQLRDAEVAAAYPDRAGQSTSSCPLPLLDQPRAMNKLGFNIAEAQDEMEIERDLGDPTLCHSRPILSPRPSHTATYFGRYTRSPSVESPPLYSGPIRATWEASPEELAFLTPPSSPTTPTRSVRLVEPGPPRALARDTAPDCPSLTSEASDSSIRDLSAVIDLAPLASTPSLTGSQFATSPTSSYRLQTPTTPVTRNGGVRITSVPRHPRPSPKDQLAVFMTAVNSGDDDIPPFVPATLDHVAALGSDEWIHDSDAALEEQARLINCSIETTGIGQFSTLTVASPERPTVMNAAPVQVEEDIDELDQLDELDESDCEYEASAGVSSDRLAITNKRLRDEPFLGPSPKRHASSLYGPGVWAPGSLSKRPFNMIGIEDESDEDPSSPLTFKTDLVVGSGAPTPPTTSPRGRRPRLGRQSRGQWTNGLSMPPSPVQSSGDWQADNFFLSSCPLPKWGRSAKLLKHLISIQVASTGSSYRSRPRPKRTRKVVVVEIPTRPSRETLAARRRAATKTQTLAVSNPAVVPEALAKHGEDSVGDSDGFPSDDDVVSEADLKSCPDKGLRLAGFKTWCRRTTLLRGRTIGPRLGLAISKDGGFSQCARRFESAVTSMPGLETVSIMMGSPKKVPKEVRSGVVGEHGPMGVFKGIVAGQATKPFIVSHATHAVGLTGRCQRRSSSAVLIQELEQAVHLGVSVLVFHLNRAVKLDKAVRTLRKVLLRVPEITLAMETLGGIDPTRHPDRPPQASDPYSLAEFVQIIQLVDMPGRLKVCVDLCHLQNEFDLSSEDGRTKMIHAVEALGAGNVGALHISDSHGSHKEFQHANLTFGVIPIRGFRDILRHPVFHNVPAILESPPFYPGHRHPMTPSRKSHNATIAQYEQRRQQCELEFLHRVIHLSDTLWDQWATPLQEQYREQKRHCEKCIQRAVCRLGPDAMDKLRGRRAGVNRSIRRTAIEKRGGIRVDNVEVDGERSVESMAITKSNLGQAPGSALSCVSLATDSDTAALNKKHLVTNGKTSGVGCRERKRRKP